VIQSTNGSLPFIVILATSQLSRLKGAAYNERREPLSTFWPSAEEETARSAIALQLVAEPQGSDVNERQSEKKINMTLIILK
jgi:hypothetical protein